MRISRFINLWWWKCLFRCRNHGYGYWRNVQCLIKGKHDPVIWYTSSGLEPDMRCQNCAEDLG